MRRECPPLPPPQVNDARAALAERSLKKWLQAVGKKAEVAPKATLHTHAFRGVFVDSGVLAVGLGIRLGDALGLVLALLGLVGALFISLGSFLVVLLRYVLVPQVVVAEGLTGSAALARSSALMAGRSGQKFGDLPKIRGSLLILVIGMVSNAIVLVASVPGLILRLSDPDNSIHLGSVGAIVSEVLALLGESAVAPFGMLALVLFYVDLRVRREGVDLDLATDALGPGPAPTPSGAS